MLRHSITTLSEEQKVVHNGSQPPCLVSVLGLVLENLPDQVQGPIPDQEAYAMVRRFYNSLTLLKSPDPVPQYGCSILQFVGTGMGGGNKRIRWALKGGNKMAGKKIICER